MDLIYCYGVVLNSIGKDIFAYNSQKVYTIYFKDLLAVVSTVSSDNFSQENLAENFKNFSWLTKNAPIHEEVVTKIMEDQTIVPMKFCTIFSSKQNIVKMLGDKYADLKENLDRLQGTVELSVKVFYSSNKLLEEVKKGSKQIEGLENEKKTKSPGAAYFVDQKIDLLAKDLLGKLLYKEKHCILDFIKNNSLEIKENDLLAKKVTKKDMVLNTAILIKRDELNFFSEKVLSLKSEHPLIEIVVSGPFPPYNFVT
jgi:hypothetical protein